MQFETDIHSEHKTLFLAARDLLLSYDEITETKKPRITTYGAKSGGICHMRTMPHGIDFGFLKGVKLNDPKGMLTGKGKTLRVLSMTSMDDALIRFYLDQAITLNTKTR